MTKKQWIIDSSSRIHFAEKRITDAILHDHFIGPVSLLFDILTKHNITFACDRVKPETSKTYIKFIMHSSMILVRDDIEFKTNNAPTNTSYKVSLLSFSEQDAILMAQAAAIHSLLFDMSKIHELTKLTDLYNVTSRRIWNAYYEITSRT